MKAVRIYWPAPSCLFTVADSNVSLSTNGLQRMTNKWRYGSVISGTREPTTVVMHSVNSSSAKDKRNGPPSTKQTQDTTITSELEPDGRPELARSWPGVGPELARSWPGVAPHWSVTDVRYSTKSPRVDWRLKRPWILPVPFRKSVKLFPFIPFSLVSLWNANI